MKSGKAIVGKSQYGAKVTIGRKAVRQNQATSGPKAIVAPSKIRRLCSRTIGEVDLIQRLMVHPRKTNNARVTKIDSNRRASKNAAELTAASKYRKTNRITIPARR